MLMISLNNFSENDSQFLFNKKHSLIVCLKTKDESEFIEIWINHYLNVVGDDGLILIFDNQSTDEKVLSVYEKFYDFTNIKILSYKGHPDGLHRPALNPNLYKALTENSLFFGFFDTDEFLYVAEAEKLTTNITNFLKVNSNYDWFPAIWFYNVENYWDQFWLRSKESIYEGIKWGKPIFTSPKFSKKLVNPIIHNVQYANSVSTSRYLTGLVCLHMTKYFPMQRIRSNFNKLKSIHGLDSSMKLTDFISNIQQIKVSNVDGMKYIEEVKKIISVKDSAPVKDLEPLPECFQLQKNGNLRFKGQYEQSLYLEFLDVEKFSFY